MVNEEKVRLMTRLAMYEQSTGKEDLEKGRYFKSDYVKYNCLKTLVSTTILFVIVVAAYIYYNMGIKYFLKQCVVKNLFPMHMWEEYSVQDKFLMEEDNNLGDTVFHKINDKKDSWRI